jgi:hypothetical protein
MPPEHEARSRAFYDHEQDEPHGRRRRAVADWGVSEDVFDRMPGPRFARRGEEPRGRFVRDDMPRGRDAWAAEDARGAAPRGRDAWTAEDARGAAPRAGDAWAAEDARGGEPREDADADAWLDEAVYADERVSRTIVIEREPELDAEFEAEPVYADPEPLPREYEPRGHVAPNGRRTIVIGGHPDRLPVPRTRPPRTAIERIGPRPDRIVGYAVAMGVLLILIAILTSS